MAIIIIEHDGRRRAGRLPARVLVGRKSMNHVVIDHRAVSRIHAWIRGEGYSYTVADAGSRTGTRINGEAVSSRRPLEDGDRITVGPATLTFHTGSLIPDGVEEIDLSTEPVVAEEERGVRFDCLCGAPLFAGVDFAGRSVQCRYCEQDLVVPHPDNGRAATSPLSTIAVERFVDDTEVLVDEPPVPHRHERHPAAAAAVAEAPAAPAPARRNARGEAVCGVCHSAISQFEETTSCPSCGLTFHAECWAENYGCSAYGCSQVNALQPPEAVAAAAAQEATVDAADAARADRPPAFPWEFLLLAGSVFSTLLGAVTFGVPALAVAGGAATYLARNRGGQRTGIVILSTALSLVGVVTGVAVSYVLYFGGVVAR